MSETTRYESIHGLEGVASLLGWPPPNKYVYSLGTNASKLRNPNVDHREKNTLT